MVLGYPELVELPKFWTPKEQQQGCNIGISAAEANEIRGLAADLNATVGSGVASFDALPASQRNNVTLCSLT